MSRPSDTCIFCRIIAGSAPVSELHRDGLCIAFLDLFPVNPGHALVCPVRHVESFTDLSDDELRAMQVAARQLARAQKERLGECEGVNVLLADGEAAGQEVSHAHFHIVPRAKGDGFGWRRSGTRAERESLDAVARRLQGG